MSFSQMHNSNTERKIKSEKGRKREREGERSKRIVFRTAAALFMVRQRKREMES